jgi:hypothetical protein
MEATFYFSPRLPTGRFRLFTFLCQLLSSENDETNFLPATLKLCNFGTFYQSSGNNYIFSRNQLFPLVFQE